MTYTVTHRLPRGVDVLISFDVTRYVSADDEYQFTVTGVTLDGTEEDVPLTVSEEAAVRAWFSTDAGYEKAYAEVCDDYPADLAAQRADYLYDCMMESW